MRRSLAILHLHVVFIAGLLSCTVDTQNDSQLSTLPGRTALKFGPEFEFIKRPDLPPFYPARNHAFAHAVRKFSQHIDWDGEVPFPDMWLPQKTAESDINIEKPIKFKGDFLFDSIPKGWPKSLAAGSIYTGGLGGSQYNNFIDPPYLEFFFHDDSKLELTFAVDDVTIEAHLNPLTTKQAELYQPMIDDMFFDATSKGGLEVPSFGGGHIHIDTTTILNRADPSDYKVGLRLLRDFVVDFHTHSYLSAYILRADPKWAQVLGMTSLEDVLDFNEKVKQLDLKIEDARFKNLKEVKKFIKREFAVFNQLIPDALIFAEITDRLAIPPETALAKPALMFSAEIDTIEIRALYAQKDMSEYINLTRMFTARLDYLAQSEGRVKLPEWAKIQLDDERFFSRKLNRAMMGELSEQIRKYFIDIVPYVPIGEREAFQKFAKDYIASQTSSLTCD